MEKKIYEKPVMQVEVFAPNEYCAPCITPSGKQIWVATCRSQQEGSCLIFFGGGADGPDDLVSDACRGGCGGSHEFEYDGSEPPPANCWLLTNVRDGSASGSSNINQYLDWFDTLGSHGVGYTIKSELVEQLIADKELVPGYYNNHILGSGRWLVTDDLVHIHPTS